MWRLEVDYEIDLTFLEGNSLESILDNFQITLFVKYFLNGTLDT